MSNHISIFRKRVITNVPGFDDPNSPQQNTWVKLADYKCVEFYPGQTARLYALEHAENYQNQDDMEYLEFNFESVRQDLKPPYNILTGDYVGLKQGTSIFWYRIVKVSATQLFSGCCVIQIMVNLTQPREAQYLLECGETQALSEEDVVGGVVYEDINGSVERI